MSEIVILAVCFQLKQLKKQPEKNSGLNGTRHLCMWLDSSGHGFESRLSLNFFQVAFSTA